MICVLPTSKEDKTTNLACVVVFLEIFENTDLIHVSCHNTKIVGKEKYAVNIQYLNKVTSKYISSVMVQPISD